jgi:hypothetical protein
LGKKNESFKKVQLARCLSEVVRPSLLYNHVKLTFEYWLDTQVFEWELQALNDRIHGNDPSFTFEAASGGKPLNQFYHRPRFREYSLFVPLPHHKGFKEIECAPIQEAKLAHMRVQNDLKKRLSIRAEAAVE